MPDIQNTQQELAEVQDRFLALAENSFDLICELDDRQRFIYTNPTYRQLLDFDAADLSGKLFTDLVHPDDAEWVRQRLESLRSQEKSTRFTFRQQRKNGLFLWMEATGKAFAKANGGSHCVLICRDATEQKSREDRLDFLANHDLLTGLHNRNALYDILSGFIQKAREGKISTVLFLDLDHLKIVNDTIGHTAGDFLIEAVSVLLQRLISDKDSLIRFAGDEFIIILNETGLEEGRARAQTICRAVGDYRFARSGQTFQIRASIGIALVDGQLNGEEIISRADTACYTAKRKGGDRVEIFYETDTQIQKLRNESNIFNRLKRAVAENRLRLWYQPIFDLSAQKTVAFEALLRVQEGDTWQPPGLFLAAAERFRGMEQVDLHILKLAFADLQQTPLLKAHVNLSGQSLGNDDLKKTILNNIQAANISPNRLILEITETAFISNLSHALEFVKELRQHGVQFALDDFGSGLSSLAYLRDIPADYIKIDGSFIRSLPNEPLNQTLVRTITEIAHLLDKKAIAEYVTDRQTCDIAAQLGADLVQGFHIDKPRPIEAITF